MLPNALRPSTTDHVPVLADEVRRLLDVQPGATVVDATFGAGGHAELLALDLGGTGRFIAVDRDPSARAYFERFRKRAGVQARFLRGEFATVLEQLATNGVRVTRSCSTWGSRACSSTAPSAVPLRCRRAVDMRMDPSSDETAADIVNDASERELDEIFRRYGEERYARPIARAIVRRRRPSRSTGRASSSTRLRQPSRRRRASAKGTRPGACSRLCASPSTTSSDSSRRRSPQPSSFCGPVDGSR